MPSDVETPTVDRLDRRLIHALLWDARASFRRLAAVLGASEQTVARRYRRLREAGIIRVVVVTDPRRFPEPLYLRVRVQPGSAVAVARAMAARRDTSWVTISAGASEVTCSLVAASTGARDALLLQGLPRAGQVTGVSTSTLLHVFADGPEAEWHGLPDGLDREEQERLGPGPRRFDRAAATTPTVAVEPDDGALLTLLARDGRASWTALADATGRTEAQVRRRVEALLQGGAVFVDVEVAPVLLGFRTWTILWISAAPAALDHVGRQLAGHPETAFVAATSGRTNLMAAVLCRDSDALYAYLTQRVGALDGVRDIEAVPTMRVVKQQGSLMDGDRLPDPLAEPG
jgi:DNA-binding Lrp family transcriptional regulator